MVGETLYFKEERTRRKSVNGYQDHPRNSRKAVSGVAHQQGLEGSDRAGLGETLGSPWPPLAIRLRGNWGRQTDKKTGKKICADMRPICASSTPRLRQTRRQQFLLVPIPPKSQ
jgi:hypothetical protein